MGLTSMESASPADVVSTSLVEGKAVEVAYPMSSPEFRLLAACAVGLRGPVRDAAVRAAVEPAPDWPAFLTIVRRHRMAPLAVDALSCAGIAPSVDLKALATRDVRQALSLCAEAACLQVRFASQGIAMAVVKGPVLSQLLYGTPGLRQCKDLDLWIAPEDVARSIAVLQADGYQVVGGPPTFASPWLDLWLATRKDSVVCHPKTGLILELHHRLTENPHVMGTLVVADALREVSVGRELLRTLSEGDLFSYLCTHGTVSRWFRLKWLADIQALLSGKSPEEVARLFDVARARGAERAAGLALWLCRRLWDLPLPAAVAERLDADRSLPWLERICINALQGPEFPHGRFRAIPNLLYLWRLNSSWAYRARLIRNLSVDWTLVHQLPLPPPLHFLYPLLRLPSWLWRRITYVTRQAA